MTMTVTPEGVHEAILTKTRDMWALASMEAGISVPEEIISSLLTPAWRVAISACSEYYAQHPEHLTFAGQPQCAVCHEPVEQWEIDSRENWGATPIKLAKPCGHQQPTTP